MPTSQTLIFLFVVTITAVSAAATAVLSTNNSMTSMTTMSTTTPSSASTTSASKTNSAAAQTFTVQVGNGDHKFKPDVVLAEIGDLVEFDFYPQNHSVIRAEYEHPCIPYEMTGKGKIGFWSGFHAIDAVLDNPPKYTVRVNDTNPVFFYCSAPDSCTKQGMVGVINPNATTSLATQRQLALQASYQLSPGEGFPSEVESPSSSTLPDGTAPQQSTPNNHGNKLNGGSIAGISIACISVVILGGLLAWFWGRFKGLKDEVKRKDSTIVRRTEPRNTWFLTSLPSSRTSPPWPSQPSQPSPPYSAHTPSPMTLHAVPPAYYELQYGDTNTDSYTSPHSPPRVEQSSSGVDGSSRISRAASQRSVGGTFEFSPVMGYYMRTHEGEDRHEYTQLRTSDMTSPVDPSLARPGPTGQLSDLQRLARSPEPMGGYIDEKGRVVGQHVNRENPAEMPDTSVQLPKFF